MTPSKRVALFGATGTAGRATAAALVAAGFDVTCFVRRSVFIDGATSVICDVTAPLKALKDGPYDTAVSCLASRTGAPQDAWAIDHRANLNVLMAAQTAGVGHFVLLSAICVQKPQLAFQHSKLAFEEALVNSGLTWSIVRPTAFFKSLSGQVARVQQGKPFLLFGNGALTACKPISDADLGAFIASCLTEPSMQNAVLPIGGPGPALTPREQATELFALLGQEPRFRKVPVAMMDAIIAGLRLGGTLSATLREKAELARIGRYYATESMLVWDAQHNRYDADATPETGTETLRDHYARLISGATDHERGEHSVF